MDPNLERTDLDRSGRDKERKHNLDEVKVENVAHDRDPDMVKEERTVPG